MAQKKGVALLLVLATCGGKLVAAANNFTLHNIPGKVYDIKTGASAASAVDAPVLSALSVNTGTLSPAFNEAITGYRVNVPYATSSIRITPATAITGATITVNEIDVASGSASPSIPLSVGINTIPVAVTTADGVTTNSYSVTVVRAVQAPHISYSTNTFVFPQSTAITPVPTVTGGAIPAVAYATTSTLNLSGGASSFQYNQFRATGICADLRGNLYMAIKNAIWKITPSGVVTLLVGQSTPGYADGTGGTVKFNNPVGIALDAAGNIYVGDAGNNRIRKVTTAGVVSTFAGSGTPGATNGTGTAASFRSPHGLAMDNAGNLYVADNGNNLIRKITPFGVTTTFAGSGAEGSANGTGTAASFNGPSAIAADMQGNLYVTCINAYGLRKITSAAVVSNIPVGVGVLGVAADAIGNVYVTCGELDSKIYKIPAGGSFEFLAGGGNIDPVRQPQKADGVGLGAAFSMPSGIVADNLGNIYLSDAGTDRLRKITVTGFNINPVIDGLAFNGATGTISGTPSIIFPAKDFTISAINAAGMDTAHLNITVQSATPQLSALGISTGALSPAFSSATTSYSVSVNNTVSSISLIPRAFGGYVIKVNGTTVVSGQKSTAIPLHNGTNTITVTVTAQNSTVKTYTLTVTRNFTSTITINKVFTYPGGLTLVGAGDNYTAQLSSGVTSVRISVATAEAGASFKVNGVAALQNTSSVPVTLTANPMVIPIEVIAEDSVTTRNMTVTVNRAASSDITLSKFFMFPGKLTRVGTTDNWTADLSSGVQSVKFGVATAETGATIKVNGVTTAQDSVSAPVMLAANPTVVPVEITAEDGVTKRTLTVTINHQYPTGDITLTKFAMYPGTMVRTGNTDNYTVHLNKGVSEAKFLVATAETNSKIYVAGYETAQNTVSRPISLFTRDSLTIRIEIVSENLDSTRTLKVKVISEPDSSSITLTKLFIYPGELTRVGTSDTWVTEVGSSVTSVKIGVITAETEETIMVNGESYGNWKPIALTGSTTSIPVEITAKDGVTKRTFTVVVSRPAPRALAATFGKPVTMGIAENKQAAVDNQAEELTVKQAVSPNGDGINDRLVIEGINAYPENTVKIMDRDGTVIYEAKGYDNQGQSFDGSSSKGVKQRPGTYFYSVEYKKGFEVKRTAGYLVIKY